jgi:hypothetical protein
MHFEIFIPWFWSIFFNQVLDLNQVLTVLNCGIYWLKSSNEMFVKKFDFNQENHISKAQILDQNQNCKMLMKNIDFNQINYCKLLT